MPRRPKQVSLSPVIMSEINLRACARNYTEANEEADSSESTEAAAKLAHEWRVLEQAAVRHTTNLIAGDKMIAVPRELFDRIRALLAKQIADMVAAGVDVNDPLFVETDEIATALRAI